jgi:hypothetical protein
MYPNLATFQSLIPDNIVQYFSSSYFVALHKDSDDDSKLHLISMGTHI